MHRAMQVFDAVVELDPAGREARLAELCADDASLRTKVETMLAADAREGEPFDDIAALERSLQEVPPGAVIGAWRVIMVAGRGGMSTVYEVERADGAYRQRAALKLVRAASGTSALRERFLRERQMLAELSHPNIAALLDGGFNDEGAPYFVMEYVEGVPLDRWCDEQRLDVAARIRLFLQAIDAVGHAHRNLLVHRDLKPSNLLVETTGRVKLLDFGIAKQLHDPEVTVLADRAVTFGYAAPEQLGDAPITTATDVWQLGVVLHLLLTGSHPFGISSDMSLPRQVQLLQKDPETLPRAAAHAAAAQLEARGESDAAALSRRLRGGLAVVVATCLRRDPAARYGSVDELATDLKRWLDDEPVLAVQARAGERARLWLRRNRVLAASIAAVALTLIAGTAVSLWQAREARRESARAIESLQFLADTLAAASPEQARSSEITVRQLLDSARQQLELRKSADPRVRQPVQRMLGRLYFSVGESHQAEALLEAGVRDIEPKSRDAALALADDLVVYSDTLAGLEKGEQSVAVADRAAALRRRFAPDDPEQQLRALAHQTLGHVFKFGWEACRQRAEQALSIALAMPDPPVDVVLRLYSDLGSIANFNNDRSRVVQLSERGLAFADERGVRDDSPQRFVLLRNRIDGLVLLDRLSEAEAVSREAIGAVERTGGSGLTSLAVLYTSLHKALRGQGRYREALAAQARVAALLADEGSGPMNLAMSRANLATLQAAVGDYPTSLRLIEEARIPMAAAGIAPDDTFRLTFERGRVQVLLANERWHEAGEIVRQQTEVARASQGEDSEDYLLSLAQHVEALRQAGDAVAGRRAIEETRMRATRRGVPGTNPMFARLLRSEAAFARREGDLAAAEYSLREAVRRHQAGVNAFELSAARCELADILAARGQRAEAVELLDQALPVMRQAVMPQQRDLKSAEDLFARLARKSRTP